MKHAAPPAALATPDALPAPALHDEDRSMEDIMAEVVKLEEQGRLVEASALMAKLGMRKTS